MKLVVIIPTYGRKSLLPRTISVLEQQTRPPDEVIVSAPSEDHAAPYDGHKFKVSMVLGRHGLCAQRNQALDQALGCFDIITFFDDDFLPANTYLEQVENCFRANPDWAVLHGDAVYDGATGPGYQFNEGLELLRTLNGRDMARRPAENDVKDHVGAYGCNMSMRASMIGDLRFDERLPLYGWQEDIDFTSQLRKHGRVVGMKSLCGVHLATKAGRQSGLRLGYSQIANLVYLRRKGTVPTGFAYRLMMRNFAANTIKSFWPEPYIDRFGRLRGNLLAVFHILKGKVEPEHILKL
jgi:glycosyltransferase involved in cell wall biosynthesis